MFRKNKDRSDIRYGKPDVGKDMLVMFPQYLDILHGVPFEKVVDRVGFTYDAPMLKLTNANIGKEYTSVDKVTRDNVKDVHPKVITQLIEDDLSNVDPGEYVVDEVRMPDNVHGHLVKWYLVRFIDSVYNEVTFRIKSWSNFTIICYINGFRVLKNYCDERRIGYKLVKEKHNAFESVDLSRQQIMTILTEALSQDNLRKMFQRHIERLLPSIACFYYPRFATGRINQIEFAYDECYPDKETTDSMFWKWVGSHRSMFPKGQLYWDEEVSSFDVPQDPGVSPQLKVYAYNNMLRVELTYNTNHLKELGVYGNDIHEVNQLADKDFKELAKKTSPIKVENKKSMRKRIIELKKMINRVEDVAFLCALMKHMWGSFKNEDIQKSSGSILDELLTRGQVQYREREKFPELIDKVEHKDGKVSRKWVVKSTVRWLIAFVLKTIDMFSLIYDEAIFGKGRDMVKLEMPNVLSIGRKKMVCTTLDSFG